MFSIYSSSSSHLPQRLVALVFSVFVALASGTPYLYGVFSPQLVKRVGLTASDSATISLASNIGSGLGGLPAGLLIDSRGPQIAILVGSVFILLGYYSLSKIYEDKIASIALICVSMAFVGLGSITAYFSTLKAAQANFPKHRGAAGAFPASAYGLSATIFSVIAATFFSDDTKGLLLFLSLCCGAVAFVGSFFVHVFIDHDEDDENTVGETSALLRPQELLRTSSEVSLTNPDLTSSSSAMKSLYFGEKANSLRGSFSFWGIGQRTPRSSVSSVSSDIAPLLQNLREQNQLQPANANPFMSRSNSSGSLAGMGSSSNLVALKKIQALKTKSVDGKKRSNAPLAIIKRRLSNKLFLTHYLVVGLASGIGQMYIYSVGFVVTAQYYSGKSPGILELASSLQEPFVFSSLIKILGGVTAPGSAASLQALQVSIISIASFSGRLVSGFLSDFIYKKFHIQRLWIVLVTTMLLALGQFISIINVNNPHLISLASAIIGASYGLTFGTYPAVIADKFGTKTFSTTWGLICTGPLFTLFVLNKYFGRIYDSQTETDGICYKGNGCYKGAFEVSLGLCSLIFVTTSLLIFLQRKKAPISLN